MNIETKVFQRKRPDFTKFVSYGFMQTKTGYHYETDFMGGDFRAIIDVDQKGHAFGTVIDEMNHEEYRVLHSPVQNGAYVSAVRSAYEGVLMDIAKQCYIDVLFESDQANRIAEQIYEKYGDRPDFPWEEKPYRSSGVFRHSDTSKWYGLIMYVKKSVFDKSEADVFVNAINLKIDPKEGENLRAEEGIYQAYHMNHKLWISVLLDDTLDDERIGELIAVSYKLTDKKKSCKRYKNK